VDALIDFDGNVAELLQFAEPRFVESGWFGLIGYDGHDGGIVPRADLP
jgi:hypothetical protein